jgi:cytochrome c biogenesis protein CcmG, thiol:disulfide interchange protein DsbE
MARTRKIIWVIAAGLFVAASLAIHYEVKVGLHRRGGSVGDMGNIKVGQPAPDFSLLDLSNQPVTLRSFRGRKVVLLDFWATWCGPCRMAMPGLQDLYERFHERGLEILSLNQGESADEVRRFMERNKYAFHALLDSREAVGNAYGVRGIPTLVLVNKQGDVQWIRVGYSPDEQELRGSIERLIGK